MCKILNTAGLRALEKKVALGEISYGKIVEIINDKFHKHYSELEKLNMEKAYNAGRNNPMPSEAEMMREMLEPQKQCAEPRNFSSWYFNFQLYQDL